MGDQARSQSFNLQALDGGGVRTSFYWRLVTAVVDDWIELSKTDCAEGSGVPQAGADIVPLGPRSAATRQNALLLAPPGSDAPSIKQYRGINGYTLSDDMAITVFSSKVNRIRGQFISEATGEDYDQTMAAMGETVKAVRADMDAVKDQTDREFTIWFYDVDPTAENLPASDWTTDALKREHVEDIYYNRTAGHAWRWMAADDGSYSWAEITDQESLRALETAAKAQDTADSKRRNFVAQPTNDQAYDIGDTWSNATYGELYDNDTLVCITAKAAGEAFSITHWQPASNATTAYIQNLGDEIRQVVADNKAAGDAATEAAQKAADDAAKAAANAATAASNAQSTADSAKTAAANAQSTADAAKSTATANATAIVQNKDAISALAGKFTFDERGNVTNVKQSGVLMSADAASLYTKQETTNALGQRVTTAEAKIETSVQKDANGNIESSAKISADQITMTGTVKFATPSDVSTAKSEAISSASTDSQQKIQALKDALGELAYQNLISAAMLDETIISGGYIKTSLIDAVNLVVQNVRAVSADGETTCEINGATGKFTAKNAKLENCNVSGCITASSGQIGRLAIGSNGEMIGSNLNIENVATAGVISGETAITWLLVDHIKSSRTFILYATGLESKAYTVWLPNINDVFGSWDYSLLIHGFMIYLFVPAVFSVLNMTESQNVATYRITPRSGCYMYNNSGSKISYIDLSKGDFVSLMGLVQCTNKVYRIDWYIHSLSQ